MAAHEQVWVQVNTKVDHGIAGVIRALTSIKGLETLQSCEGTPDGDAYVYFWCGDWDQICRLVFGGILPALAGIETTAAVEVFNGSPPTAKIGFSARDLDKATLALESFAITASNSLHMSESSRDMECRVPMC
jgi:hypothetical protein